MKTLVVSYLILISFCLNLTAQVEFKKGYIIDTKGQKVLGQIQLLDIQDPNGFFEKVHFQKDGIGETIITYSPSQIQEFGFGSAMVFKSFSVPMLDKTHQLKEIEPSQKFLRQLNSGKITFYALRRTGRYFSFFYTENGEALKPLKVEKKSVENLRTVNGDYKLSEEMLINDPSNGSKYETGGRVFLFDNGMFELIPHYKLTLMQQLSGVGCDISSAEEITKLNKRTIFNHLKAYNQCEPDQDFSINSGSPLFNVSLFLMGSTRAGITSTDKNRSIGGMVEIKSLSFSSRLSLAFGHFQFLESERSFLSEIIVDNRPTFRTDTIIETISGQSNLLRIGYHFRPEKNLRPFLYAGIQVYDFDATRVDTQGLRTPSSSNLNFYSPHLGAGLDWHFLKFNQLRLQFGRSNGFEYYVGYGVNFTL